MIPCQDPNALRFNFSIAPAQSLLRLSPLLAQGGMEHLNQTSRKPLPHPKAAPERHQRALGGWWTYRARCQLR